MKAVSRYSGTLCAWLVYPRADHGQKVLSSRSWRGKAGVVPLQLAGVDVRHFNMMVLL